MPTSIHQKIRLAEAGELANAILKMPSGWLILSEFQPVEGYCILLRTPVVQQFNDLDETGRIQYSLDMLKVGDALLKMTGCKRINYETWGNVDPALHTHIVPRYESEPEIQRKLPICKGYQFETGPKFDPAKHKQLMLDLRDFLTQ